MEPNTFYGPNMTQYFLLENVPGAPWVTVYLTVGLPGCGKTTWAESYVKHVVPETGLVCRDDFRRRHPKYVKGKRVDAVEKDAKKWRDEQMVAHLALGRNVIIADTNLNVEARVADVTHILHGLSKDKNYAITVADFRDAPIEFCIKNDKLREHMVGADVIVKMFHEHICPPTLDYRTVPVDQRCIIVDLDGTIAHAKGRSCYAEEGYLDDEPDLLVIEIIKGFLARMVHEQEMTNAYNVYFLSGRAANETGIEEISEWLERYFPGYLAFHTRNVEDKRPDYVVKREFYDDIVECDNMVPIVAFDDRPQVCRLWESLGLKVIKVGPYYEF